MEEAIRLKEKKVATEIIAVSIGNKSCQESLRTALAMGADKGIHINTEMRTDQELQPLAVAKLLKYIAERVLGAVRDDDLRRLVSKVIILPEFL